MRRALVLGGGGFIGHHMVKYLKERGYWVRASDIKPAPDFEVSPANEYIQADLRIWEDCIAKAFGGPDFDEVYTFAAWMGGIAFITSHFADLTRNNVQINTNVFEAARHAGMGRLFYASSACVYPHNKQDRPDVAGLREVDAWPASPEPGYGLEKLFTEELARFYHLDYKLDVRVARFHNCFGPLGTFEGGKEKAPAAICRKVALADHDGAIQIWGDGKQTRSFIYIDDLVEGVYRLMSLPDSTAVECHGATWRPYMALNVGTDYMVSIDDLVAVVCQIAGKDLRKVYQTDQPQGVRGRNSDNTLMRAVLHWEPTTPLGEGLARTYAWIVRQLKIREHV